MASGRHVSTYHTCHAIILLAIDHALCLFSSLEGVAYLESVDGSIELAQPVGTPFSCCS